MSARSDHADLFSCAGMTAVVAGGAGLIGREVAAGLAQAGANVWVADVEIPDDVRGVSIDIADEGSVERALDAVIAADGRLDVVVNCAYPRTSDWGSPLESELSTSWVRNLEMQLGGCFIISRAAAKRMEGRGGSIINFGSIYGSVGPSWEIYEDTSMTMPSAYAAIKGGVVSLTRLLATRYGPSGVRCNVVSPGGVFDGQPEPFVARYEALTPLGRMADPADVVGAVIFLASPASAYVTGQNLIVDGGWTAR